MTILFIFTLYVMQGKALHNVECPDAAAVITGLKF